MADLSALEADAAMRYRNLRLTLTLTYRRRRCRASRRRTHFCECRGPRRWHAAPVRQVDCSPPARSRTRSARIERRHFRRPRRAPLRYATSRAAPVDLRRGIRPTTDRPDESYTQHTSNVVQIFCHMIRTIRASCARGDTICPAPLLLRGHPSALRAAEQMQRSSTFPRRIRPDADRCSHLTR